MSRTRTATKIEAFSVEPIETTGTTNAALVVPDFHIPTPSEINQLTEEEVSAANKRACQMIDLMISTLKLNFYNNQGVAASMDLNDSKISSKVRDYTFQRVKELMLESGWYVSLTKRHPKYSENTTYDYYIEDNSIRLIRVSGQKAKALKRTRLQITLGIAVLVVFSVVAISLFVV